MGNVNKTGRSNFSTEGESKAETGSSNFNTERDERYY
jgi:hypothetical protein